jgi:hypothetical protein
MLRGPLKNMKNHRKIGILNTKAILVAILVLVLPLGFFYITQSFLNTATNNINTVQLQKLELIHRSITSILSVETSPAVPTLTKYISDIALHNPEMVGMTVVEKVGSEKRLVITTEGEVLQNNLINDSFTNTSGANGDELSIVKSDGEFGRVWESTQVVNLEGREYSIQVTQDFSNLDQILYSRVQQSYLGLSFIFIFLIALAYWLNRQVFWQEKFDESQGELCERDKLFSQTVHELRAPLTAIKGYTSFLKESEHITEENARFVANISQSTDRLIYLVSDFAELGQLQSGKILASSESVRIKDVFEDIVSSRLDSSVNDGLELSVEVSDAMTLKTDRSKLQTVLSYLITNVGAKCNRAKIQLSAQQQYDQLILAVTCDQPGTAEILEDNLIISPDITGRVNLEIVKLLGATINVRASNEEKAVISLIFEVPAD